jgi:rubrerythrin
MPHQSENLICAQCAYPLKGIASDAACPECGLGIPAARFLTPNPAPSTPIP